MKTINRLKAYVKLVGSNGKIFTVRFIKKDGSLRTMNCRRGVTKGVKGVGLRFDPLQKLLLPVFDMQKNEFRMINLDTLQSMKIGGEEFKVI